MDSRDKAQDATKISRHPGLGPRFRGDDGIKRDYIECALHYALPLMTEDDKIKVGKIMEDALHGEGEVIMKSAAESLIEEGWMNGMSLDVVSKITGFSEQELVKIRKVKLS